jgi:hypothetical protein
MKLSASAFIRRILKNILTNTLLKAISSSTKMLLYLQAENRKQSRPAVSI